MRARVVAGAAMAVLLACSLALSGCSSDDASSTAASTSASPSPTPTPSSVVWAGEVCVARDGLSTAVSALGRNLNYDVTSDRSALEQIDRQLRLQVVALGNAADNLATALQGVPVDFQAASDLVTTVTKAKTDMTESLAAAKSSLDQMVASDNLLTGAAEAAKALVAAKAAFEAGQAMVTALTDAASGANAELKEAFDAAPQCQ
ncbi:MAG: hypothetical protein U0R65_01870 [Candidatus Nanopelagicales bacterium]|jgi:hypothetical protein